MRIELGRLTLRTVLLVVGVIFLVVGLCWGILDPNPVGRIDIILFVLGLLLMIIAFYMKNKESLDELYDKLHEEN